MSGALQKVLAETALFLERSEAMRQHVISAMVYPAILVAVATLSVGLILTAVLPQFEPMFKEAGAKLPMMTRIVVAASDALRGYWWVMAVFAVAVAGAWRAAVRSRAGAAALDRAMLALPLVGPLVLRAEIGRFCRTLGVMLASGVPAPAALSLAGATMGNGVLAAAVEDAAGRFREGEGLSAPLARTGRFPTMALQLIRIGEETARLDDMLGEVANLFDQEVQRSLERLLAALVPGLTVIMGLLVALIVGAVMSALMSVNALAV
jgi:general secretion pathway protein F